MKNRIHPRVAFLSALLFSTTSVYAAPIAVSNQQDQRPAVAVLDQQPASQPAAQNDPAAKFENRAAAVQVGVIGGDAGGTIIGTGQSFLIQPTQPHSFPVYPEDSVLNAKCSVSGNTCHTNSDGRFVLEVYQRGKISASYIYQRQNGTNILNESTEYSRDGNKIKTTHYRLDVPIVNGQQIVKLIPSTVTFFDAKGKPTHKDFLNSNGSTEKTETYRGDGKISRVIYFNPETKQRTKREDYTYDPKTNRLQEILIYMGNLANVLTSKKTFSHDASGNLMSEKMLNWVKVGKRFEWQLVPVSISNITVSEVFNPGVLFSFDVTGLPAGQSFVLDYRKQGEVDWKHGGFVDGYKVYLENVPNDGSQYDYRLRVVDNLAVNTSGEPAKVSLIDRVGIFQAVIKANVSRLDPITTTQDSAEIIWGVSHLLPEESSELIYRKKGEAVWQNAQLCNFSDKLVCTYLLEGTSTDGEQTRGTKISNLEVGANYEFEIHIARAGQVLSFQRGDFKTQTPSTGMVVDIVMNLTASEGAPVKLTAPLQITANGSLNVTTPAGLVRITGLFEMKDGDLTIDALGNVTISSTQPIVMQGVIDLPGQIIVDTNGAALTNVAQIAGAGAHSLALLNDGTVAAWGSKTSIVETNGAVLTNISQIAGDGAHSLALLNDGTVKAWGSNALESYTSANVSSQPNSGNVIQSGTNASILNPPLELKALTGPMGILGSIDQAGNVINAVSTVSTTTLIDTAMNLMASEGANNLGVAQSTAKALPSDYFNIEKGAYQSADEIEKQKKKKK